MELFNDPTYPYNSIAWFWVPRLILSNLEETTMNNHLTNINVYPNPLDTETTVSFQVSKTTKTQLSIYSVDGKLMQILFDDTAEIGVNYAIPFEAKSWTKGIYLVEMKTETGERKVEKLILN